jgi:hypothetical protein
MIIFHRYVNVYQMVMGYEWNIEYYPSVGMATRNPWKSPRESFQTVGETQQAM